MATRAEPTTNELPEILARGPWDLSQVTSRWRAEHFEPPPAHTDAADAEIAGLAPARLTQPRRPRGAAGGLQGRPDTASSSKCSRCAGRCDWCAADASASVAALCVTRAADGRWLAGRRAAWLSSWAGRWALGAGGAVDLGENPADTLVRELHEEWSVSPERVRGEALVRLPHRLVMFVGQAWLPEGAEVTPDHEHDEYAWWPSEIEEWPPEAEESLRRMARWLSE